MNRYVSEAVDWKKSSQRALSLNACFYNLFKHMRYVDTNFELNNINSQQEIVTKATL